MHLSLIMQEDHEGINSFLIMSNMLILFLRKTMALSLNPWVLCVTMFQPKNLGMESPIPWNQVMMGVELQEVDKQP